MTIVIPYKDDILSGVELRFALRSIDQHLTGFTDLIIIGTPPDWYNGHYMASKDFRGRKQYSIYSKLLLACGAIYKHGDWVREENFVMWNDDHFLIKDLHTAQIDNWYDGKLKDTLHRNHGVRYKEAIANTLQIIPEALNYDIHTPCVYNKTAFKEIFSNRKDEICIKSFYFEHYIPQPGDHYYEMKEMQDHKINQLLSKEAIKELIKDRLFFSTSTNGMKKPMIELLNELFPKPSKWEL